MKKAGTGWLDVLFPPAAMGAIVAVIGLELAGVAAGMAGLLPAEGQTPDSKTIIISITTLAVTVLGSVLFRGFLAIIPILIGVLVGYALSFAMGIVDTTPIINAHWFALPTLYTPRFEWFAILTILPAALVVIAEHVGHLVVTANIVKKDLLRDPGLHRSMFANGLSTVISGFFGSTPNTTYGENIGVMAITRVYSTWVIGGAAIFAILLSCVGKLAAAIQMIPLPVMGGVSLLLYGVIGASGIRVLIESKVDYNKAQNLILTSVILIIGVSGAKVNIGAKGLKNSGAGDINLLCCTRLARNCRSVAMRWAMSRWINAPGLFRKCSTVWSICRWSVSTTLSVLQAMSCGRWRFSISTIEFWNRAKHGC
ncbi:hypothetical protein ECZU03_05650 [Escherichia coli]|nr:hypothetical protein ECZU03_05650 [Escherichia coli]